MSRWTHADPGEAALAVTTHALSKRYGAVPALDRVELRVPEGSVYLLLGANGAGKSTALRILMNLVRPDSGAARVFGLDVADAGPRARAQIGYVPEHHEHGYGWMTCGRLLRHLSAFYPAWDDAYAAHLVQSLGVREERKVGTLSKGEARRLHLVTALAHRPPLLLLDEPTDGLDPGVRRRALTLLAEHLADAPTTVLICTHQVYEVESLADHVGVLREGRLVAQMPRDALQRTVQRYRVEVPDGWEAPPGLQLARERRSSAGREVQWTLVGEEREVVERLALAGARVREVKPLALEDAALAFLDQEVAP